MNSRICPHTGLKLVEVAQQIAFRVQQNEHPAISAPARYVHTKCRSWGRYDTIGWTLYLSDAAICVFQETIAPFKRNVGAVDPLAKVASQLGIKLEALIDKVDADWEEKQFLKTGTLPSRWRKSRGFHVVNLPTHGWLVDIEAPESISAIEQLFPKLLIKVGIKNLDVSHLRSGNRTLTTSIAERIRSVTLFDGSGPLGIAFDSRHGSGTNYAIWFRVSAQEPVNPLGGAQPQNFTLPAMEVLASKQISHDDYALVTAARLFKIRVL